MMPDVTNMSVDQAVAAMRARGWTGNKGTLTIGKTEVPNLAQIGLVVQQNPAKDTAFDRNGLASINIGVEPMITVPDLGTGVMTFDQAQQALANAGFEGRIEPPVIVPNPPPGQGDKVRTQSVPANSQLPKYSGSITLEVWAPNPPPPSTVTVPTTSGAPGSSTAGQPPGSGPGAGPTTTAATTTDTKPGRGRGGNGP
ncbi:PASTA domain-containing protein [Nakamurella lactea]